MGDLNKRRGRVLGMNPDHKGNQIIEADIPMMELLRILHRPSFHDRWKRRILPMNLHAMSRHRNDIMDKEIAARAGEE